MNKRQWVKTFSFIGVLFCSLCLAPGCASTIKIGVESNTRTNGGRPFYAIVRSVEAKTFISENYKLVADRVFSHPADPSILSTQLIIPGRSMHVEVTKPERADLALYFFFTTPGDKWRVPFHQPMPAEVVVELGSNQIKRVKVRKR